MAGKVAAVIALVVVGAASLHICGAAAAASRGCTDDTDCLAPPSQPDWRCAKSPTAGVGKSCEIPGPSGKNSTCVCVAPKCAAPKYAAPTAGKKQYLMVGDSISIGQHTDVFSALADVADSFHNPGNAANSNLGSHCVATWLGPDTQRWDVVSFQFGLHDMAHDTEWLTPDLYRQHLTDILQTLLTTTRAKLIWTTTTPVPDAPVHPPRFNKDVITLNGIADEVIRPALASGRIASVVPLYDAVIDKCGAGYSSCSIQLPNNVHYTAAGWKYLAANTTAHVRAALAG